MAFLTKSKDRWRVRFNITFPSGAIKERQRLFKKKGQATTVKILADSLEQKTRRQQYNQADVELWTIEGVIRKPDAAILTGYEQHHKTLAQAADEYRATWHNLSSGEEMTREGRVARLVEILGPETPVQAITYLDGERLKKTLATMTVRRNKYTKKTQKLKAATINKHLQDLKRMFKIQLATRCIDHYPFTITNGLKIPKAEKIKQTTISDEQIAAVIEAAEEKDRGTHPPLAGQLALTLLLFFGCGLRRKEALAARFDNIDWQARTLTLTDTKNDEDRIVGLGPRLIDKLAARNEKSGFILPRYHAATITRAIMRHLKSCGFDMRLHDARHTFTTRLLDLGVGTRAAMKRTGHKSEAMLKHYDHGDASPEIFEDGFGFLQAQTGQAPDKAKLKD